MSRFAAALVSCVFLACAPVTVHGQAPDAVITGRVVDYSDSPLTGAIVDVYGYREVATVSDSNGSFTLRVPASGDFIVRARAPGYGFELLFVEIERGAVADAVLRLFMIPIPFSGEEISLPAPDRLAQAERIITDVLGDTAVQSYIGRERASTEGDVMVWIPWAGAAPSWSAPGELSMRVSTNCDACVAETWPDVIHGLRRYRAGMDHVRVGVVGRGLHVVTYAQGRDGQWLRIPDERPW